jgi:ribosomal protein S6--L-glutamate ligase
MPAVIELLKDNGIPMVNPYVAHFYEISKSLSTKMLATNGFITPKVYGVFTPAQMMSADVIEYPCVIKPECGGRTNYTYIVNTSGDLRCAIESAPDILFIAQEYIPPEYGFITRIEVIGRSCRLVLKRSVAKNGLSAYHLGSVYAHYDNCPAEVKEAAVRAMGLLHIETGSLDIIENKNGFFIIDVNSVSNVSEDNTEMFSFSLMEETAAYIVEKYSNLIATY